MKIELKPVSGKKTVEIDSPDIEMMNTIGVEPKFRINAQLIGPGGRRKKVRLIGRQDNVEELDAANYSENWKLFKEAGLPVVPTLRKTENGKVVMTDLIADGSELYGKELGSSLSTVHEFKLKNDFKKLLKDKLKLVKSFLDILKDEEFKHLKSKLAGYENLANQNRIYLPFDDPFELLVHPDGKWELIIIDLRTGGKRNVYFHAERTPDENNKKCIKLFFDNILVIKEMYEKMMLEGK